MLGSCTPAQGGTHEPTHLRRPRRLRPRGGRRGRCRHGRPGLRDDAHVHRARRTRTAIPLGDGYVSTSPKVGYVDACQTSFRGGGAEHAGPWIDETAKTWDITTKIAVSGARLVAGRVLLGQGHRRQARGHVRRPADRPHDGRLPDRLERPGVPRTTATRTRIASPEGLVAPAAEPEGGGEAVVRRASGAIGVLSDGVYLYNGLDAAGRDAAAHEVQDACAGHPDSLEQLPPPRHPAVHPRRRRRTGTATLVGYALDGYGIYVVKDAHGNLPTNTDLDACHGTTSVVDWNGKPTSDLPLRRDARVPVHGRLLPRHADHDPAQRRQGPRRRRRPGRRPGQRGRPGRRPGRRAQAAAPRPPGAAARACRRGSSPSRDRSGIR